jgi:EAL domain-containing protein (putative c-di-GMP-specific phosphodiesterase class I)
VAGHEDTVARLPGAQFAVLFSSSKASRNVLAFTEQLRKAIARPISMRTQEVFLTATLGVAGYREKGETAEDLLKEAMIALYEAKRRGTDTMEFFRSSMRDDRSELVALESELRRALERNEIEVLYQPIARLADMDLAGFEALIRWRHGSFGLLAPESFMSVAETTGIIKELARFVLNDAARNLGIWQRAFRAKQPLFIAVNIPSSEIIGTELVDELKAIMAREGIQRETLKLEITESMVMQSPELSVQLLDRLKQTGVGLACSDFGSGYSSLSSLRRIPFDTLKVDRGFFEPAPGDDKAAIILETVMLLAHELGLPVIAEGIQSQEHVDRLGELNCDMGQGKLFGEPMTAKQVVDALSGLPYAANRNKSVIAALLERVGSAGPTTTAPEPGWQSSSDGRTAPPEPEATLVRAKPSAQAPVVQPEQPAESKTEAARKPPFLRTTRMAPRGQPRDVAPGSAEVPQAAIEPEPQPAALADESVPVPVIDVAGPDEPSQAVGGDVNGEHPSVEEQSAAEDVQSQEPEAQESAEVEEVAVNESTDSPVRPRAHVRQLGRRLRRKARVRAPVSPN